MENAHGESIDFSQFNFHSLSIQRPEEHLLKNQEFDREGYLFLIERSTSTHTHIETMR